MAHIIEAVTIPEAVNIPARPYFTVSRLIVEICMIACFILSILFAMINDFALMCLFCRLLLQELGRLPPPAMETQPLLKYLYLQKSPWELMRLLTCQPHMTVALLSH
jgi:hypothetical protein